MLSRAMPEVMMMSSEGFFYSYNIDLENGGECALMKQYNPHLIPILFPCTMCSCYLSIYWTPLMRELLEVLAWSTSLITFLHFYIVLPLHIQYHDQRHAKSDLPSMHVFSYCSSSR